MKKIIVITTEGGAPEDGNVYYSRYLIVESTTLKFDEPIFTDPDFGPRGESNDCGCDNERLDEVKQIIRDLGYTVEVPDIEFIEVKTS